MQVDLEVQLFLPSESLPFFVIFIPSTDEVGQYMIAGQLLGRDFPPLFQIYLPKLWRNNSTGLTKTLYIGSRHLQASRSFTPSAISFIPMPWSGRTL